MTERTSLRLTVLGVFLAALMAVLGLRLAQLVFLRGPDLARAAEQNRTRLVADPAQRGLILDSEGRPLVGNGEVAALQIDRQTAGEQPDGGVDVLARAAAAVGLTVPELRQRLIPCAEPDAPPRPVCDDGSPVAPVTVPATDGEAGLLAIAENPADNPGLSVTTVPVRAYPFESVTAGHLLGFLGEVSAEELAAGGLNQFDRVGRGGLEQQYDAELRGVSGQRRLLVDATGSTEGVEQRSAAVPGNSLVTSINADVQQRLEAELDQALAMAGSTSARAAAVVLDLRTGRIVAMGSKPDVDPRAWVDGLSEDRYRALSRGGALIDYPLQAEAPPGSTFKPITVVAMQRAGFPLHGSYDCPGTYTAGGRTFANHDSQAYGTISLTRAIEVSCNTVFYRAGDRLWQRGGGDRVGRDELDPIAQAAADLGLGTATGVDLPGEADGMVASPAAKYDLWLDRREAWCAAAEAGYPKVRRTDPAKADFYTALDRENCRTGQRWRQGDAINAAIGQGLTAVTPLQLAVAYAAIADGGRVWQPTVGRALVGPDGQVVREIDPRVRSRARLAPPVVRFLRDSMSLVPRSGTAATAFAGFPLDRYPVAGKTGSAQVAGENSTSWFGSFAPADDPRYVVMVMVSNGGAGGETAAPAARGIYETLFGVDGPAAFPATGPSDRIPAVQGVRR